MTILTVHQTICALINETFPSARFPAENRLLLARYASQPDPTPALEQASLQALGQVSRLAQLNPSQPETEIEALGLTQFGQEFALTLQADLGRMLSPTPQG